MAIAEIGKIKSDCDVEFADVATKLAAEHVSDPRVVEYIHAVMSSCNKSPLQKMTESSVFLLHKGTISPKVMEEIKENYDRIQKKKDLEMSKKMNQLPPELYSTAQKLRIIATSAGLSGNERKQQIDQLLASLPDSYHHKILNLLVETPSKFDGAPVQQPETPIDLRPAPASFEIPKQTEETEPASSKNTQGDRDPRVNMPFNANASPMNHIQIHPQPITASQQNILFPDLPPTRPITPTSNDASTSIGALFKNPNIEMLLKNLVQKGVKLSDGPLPANVGAVDHTKNQPDMTLLNPSLWSDAAKFLSQSSNDLPTALSKLFDANSAGISSAFGRHHSRAPPQIASEAQFLPSRRQFDGALDSYDTHVDRFASSGPPNRQEILGDLSSLRALPQPAIQPTKVDAIIGAMPTMPPVNGYQTYAPAPTAAVPSIVPAQQQLKSPEEITGSYRQSLMPVYNVKGINGQMRNVKIDAVNEQ
ncbi:unnamed protein product [Caenorhabditis bovis]|uniref:Uncharacterized protein n=1 Tax=Caenorhabditis bovis TaxID=2654633 RepID=A0A8S1EXV7_9PELO|nr:unnamed protein product [Caenorhabditis bovis]